jgi:hypothetical protein
MLYTAENSNDQEVATAKNHCVIKLQKLILHMGEDPDIKHRYQLIVKALGTFDELCKIRADLCASGFEIYNINDDTIEGVFLGDNMECWERIRELDKAGWVWKEYLS